MVALPVQQPIHSILLSSRSNEWYTPSVYVEAAREVMGSIDVDPASNLEANQVVKAKLFYTKQDNGLEKHWHGNIWCNPPYGTTCNKSNASLWIKKLISEYRLGHVSQAILLVNSNTDTRWFHQLFEFPICFTEGRINFYSSVHKTDTAFARTKTGHTHGSAFAYLGMFVQRFIDVFSAFGTLVQRVSNPKNQPINLELW